MEKQADDNHDKAKVLKAEIIKVTEETLVKETEETILSKDRQAVEVNSDSDSDKADEGDDRDKIFMSKLDEFYKEYYLSDFQKFAVTKFLRENVAAGKQQVARIRDWMINKMNGVNRTTDAPKMQKGCPEIIPGLRALPFWHAEQLPWISAVENCFDEIKTEVLALRSQKGFQPYRGPSWTSDIKTKDGVGRQSNDSGEWNVFYLYLHNIRFEANCEKVPRTVDIIEKLFPRHYHHAFISAVTPGTHIMKHHGPTNKKLRFHMPICGVRNSRLRAGEVVVEQEAGKCYVFDDSFEHEAWHDGEETRIVLIVDIWHPDLTIAEVKFLSLIQNARMRAEKIISEQDAAQDNFYTIIELSRDALESNDWWTVNSEQTVTEYRKTVNEDNRDSSKQSEGEVNEDGKEKQEKSQQP